MLSSSVKDQWIPGPPMAGRSRRIPCPGSTQYTSHPSDSSGSSWLAATTGAAAGTYSAQNDLDGFIGIVRSERVNLLPREIGRGEMKVSCSKESRNGYFNGKEPITVGAVRRDRPKIQRNHVEESIRLPDLVDGSCLDIVRNGRRTGIEGIAEGRRKRGLSRPTVVLPGVPDIRRMDRMPLPRFITKLEVFTGLAGWNELSLRIDIRFSPLPEPVSGLDDFPPIWRSPDRVADPAFATGFPCSSLTIPCTVRVIHSGWSGAFFGR